MRDGSLHARRATERKSPGKGATQRPAEPTKAPRHGMGAAAVWQRCRPATEDHPYIVAKQGTPHGLRVVPEGDPLVITGQRMCGALVVPVVPLGSATGEPVSLQFIPPPGAGKKLNLPGASLAGVFVVGEIAAGATLHIVEGIGQAWACWRATGSAAVVCFGWGRVAGVAAELRKRDAEARLVLVPDVGKERAAEAIARDVQALVVALPDGWPKNSDCNDLALSEGIEALELLLSSARAPSVPSAPSARTAHATPAVRLIRGDTITLEPVRWLWPEYLPAAMLTILGGAPGSGKTTIALSLAAVVTRGGVWPDGSRCADAGDVIVWSGEDDRGVIASRLKAAGADMRRVYIIDGITGGGGDGDEVFDPTQHTWLCGSTPRPMASATSTCLPSF